MPTVKNNPNADWVSAPIVSNDSEPAKVVNDLGVIAYWVVNKNMEHPEVVMKMLNEFTKVFYENSDKATYDKYVNAEDGSEIWQNSLVRTYRGFKNLSGYQNINAVINGTKKETELTPEESGNYANIKKYMDNGDIDGWAWSKIYGVGGSMGVIETYQKEDRYIQNQYDGTPSDSMAKYQSTLDKMEIEAFTNIIKGADISTFDEFVTNWKASGGDKITEELNSK